MTTTAWTKETRWPNGSVTNSALQKANEVETGANVLHLTGDEPLNVMLCQSNFGSKMNF